MSYTIKTLQSVISWFGIIETSCSRHTPFTWSIYLSQAIVFSSNSESLLFSLLVLDSVSEWHFLSVVVQLTEWPRLRTKVVSFTNIQNNTECYLECCLLTSEYVRTSMRYIVCLCIRQSMLLLRPSSVWSVDWIPFQKIRSFVFPFPSAYALHLYVNVPFHVYMHNVTVLSTECLRSCVTIWSNWLKQQQRKVKWALGEHGRKVSLKQEKPRARSQMMTSSAQRSRCQAYCSYWYNIAKCYTSGLITALFFSINQIQNITEDYTRKLEHLLEAKTKELLGAWVMHLDHGVSRDVGGVHVKYGARMCTRQSRTWTKRTDLYSSCRGCWWNRMWTPKELSSYRLRWHSFGKEAFITHLLLVMRDHSPWTYWFNRLIWIQLKLATWTDNFSSKRNMWEGRKRRWAVTNDMYVLAY